MLALLFCIIDETDTTTATMYALVLE